MSVSTSRRSAPRLTISPRGRFIMLSSTSRAPMSKPRATSPSRAASGWRRLAAAGGAARVGHLPKGFPQGLKLADFERAAGPAAVAFGGLAGGRQLARAHQHTRLGGQFFEPELLGPTVGNVKVRVVLRVAFGQPGRPPARVPGPARPWPAAIARPNAPRLLPVRPGARLVAGLARFFHQRREAFSGWLFSLLFFPLPDGVP